MYASVCPVEEKHHHYHPLSHNLHHPFAYSQVPSNPCALWSGLLWYGMVWCGVCVKWPTDRFLTVCVGRFLRPQKKNKSPPVFCNLPVNHIWGLQTAQQAPTGELMMFSPLWSHSSLSKLLTIYLDVIIVCDIIKEEIYICVVLVICSGESVLHHSWASLAPVTLLIRCCFW